MARRIAVSNLNASTIDILNTIRTNATYEYQQNVPVVETEVDIPKVGEVLYGYPALANQFVNALINRIAAVRVKSATFNNEYAELKKGYLEFGETVEEVFVNIAKARTFSPEKAASRELKRTLPDVKSAFHAMNWRVQYPVTIQQEDLRMAFLSMNGVQDLIAKIVDSVYTAAEQDEYLLFKYLLIKAIAHGKMFPVGVDFTDFDNAAVNFRGMSNQLKFLSTKYNESGVENNTRKEDQYIFMDAMFNARYDVKTLAAAFNMEKADFSGKLKLIDSWDTFDNTRFEAIQAESDALPPVTEEELTLMRGVKAVLVDKEWFQIYDNANTFSETYVSSGLYWNYNYNVWKTISHSPFSNAIVFVDSAVSTTQIAELTLKVESFEQGNDKDGNPTTEVINFTVSAGDTLASTMYKAVQTKELTSHGIAVHPFGSYVGTTASFTSAENDEVIIDVNGTKYGGKTVNDLSALTVGGTMVLTKK